MHSAGAAASSAEERTEVRRAEMRFEEKVTAVPSRTREEDGNEICKVERALQPKAHARIPGGAHTYAKGDDQYPVLAPGFIARGQGCHVWDVDGNEFIEYGMGLRAVGLGHAYRPVVEAAYRAMLLGNNFTRPSPFELDCADELAGLIESAEMVKFGKNGSDATSACGEIVAGLHRPGSHCDLRRSPFLLGG